MMEILLVRFTQGTDGNGGCWDYSSWLLWIMKPHSLRSAPVGWVISPLWASQFFLLFLTADWGQHILMLQVPNLETLGCFSKIIKYSQRFSCSPQLLFTFRSYPCFSVKGFGPWTSKVLMAPLLRPTSRLRKPSRCGESDDPPPQNQGQPVNDDQRSFFLGYLELIFRQTCVLMSFFC